MKQVIVSGGFDNAGFADLRFLHQASRWGEVNLVLWSDQMIETATGSAPKFGYEERQYFWEAVRFIRRVRRWEGETDPNRLPEFADLADAPWVIPAGEQSAAKLAHGETTGRQVQVLSLEELVGYPDPAESHPSPKQPGAKKVLVTGCYDWLHSGHVRFFEEVSSYGRLFVVAGNDQNVSNLKGPNHPLFPQEQRRYQVQCMSPVEQALISSGQGWLDAEPEIERLQPDIYAVNEDGHQPVKEDYCAAHGIEYLVLKRTPKEGLPRRQSTDLRGF